MKEKDLDFFTVEVERQLLHPNFSRVMAPHKEDERQRFLSWAKGMIDRDGKLVKEFQTTFNSTFWEVYLNGVFNFYNFDIDWSHSAPDFYLKTPYQNILVEAVTAGAAHNKKNEWDKSFSEEEMESIREFKLLNTEAIIRLSNSIVSKVKKYRRDYKELEHVKRLPFIIAIAPFEQPLFNHQYDRPIRALLYDDYVDEDAYLANPERYPEGPPNVNLGYVEKDNGSEIELGLFNDPCMNEVSAVIFSCLATWGKLGAMGGESSRQMMVVSSWATPPSGEPEKRLCKSSEHYETIVDGLHVFHNPFAKRPLDYDTFRGHRVIQMYGDLRTSSLYRESKNDELQFRWVYPKKKGV